MSQRRRNGGEIGFRASTSEGCNGVSGEAELSRQPAQRMPLDLVRARRGAPVGELRVVHSHQSLGDHRRERHGWIEQAQVSRMSYLNLPGAKHPLGVLDDLIEWKLFPEVILAGQIATNLVHRDRRNDGASRDIGLHPLEFML